MFLLTLQLLALALSVVAVSRTSPPSGALVVRAGTTTPGEYATLLAAVAALPNDSSSRSIFIYPGTYQGQVNIQRTGPTIVCLEWIHPYIASKTFLNRFMATLPMLWTTVRTRPCLPTLLPSPLLPATI